MGTSRIVDPGSSPLSRGIRSWVALPVPPRGIIPALAGNTRVWRTSRSRQRDHPRSRGEYVRPPRTCTPPNGSSPLSRGIRAPRNNSSGSNRIIPALAGNTPERPHRLGHAADHPRSRGEYDVYTNASMATYGSSPLSRGIPRHVWSSRGTPRIIPALAGNTLTVAPYTAIGADHPRSRGEYLRPTPSLPLVVRIIPALAGNTPSAGKKPMTTSDHPRSRGEYVFVAAGGVEEQGSSPLSRGIRRVRGWR
mgnify:CR=1 FL=1